MRFRFVHAADLHLDTPFSGIAQAEPRVALALRDASLDAWDALVELTLREQAAFLLLAGDIYDGPSRGLRAQLRFLRGVERLCGAGIQVFAVHGNHDPLGAGWAAVRAWPEGMTFFPADRMTAVTVERQGQPLATVHGISFARAEEGRNLARLFSRSPGGGLAVGLLHANVGGDAEYGNYAPCTPADLRAGGMDYWALGHVHRRRVVLGGDPCWAAYPGNLQGRSPAPGELGAKGALVVECEAGRGGVGEPRFVPLDRARFVQLQVDASQAADTAAAVRLIGEELARLRTGEEHAGRGLVVRLGVRGGGELARLEGELLSEVRAQAEDLDPFVWCERLDVAVQSEVSREAVAGRGDFAADLVEQVDELAADPGALATLLRELDGELPAALQTALRGEAADPQALLRDAERECLRLLLGEDGGA